MASVRHARIRTSAKVFYPSYIFGRFQSIEKIFFTNCVTCPAVRFFLYNLIYNFGHCRYNIYMDRAIWYRKIKLSEAEKAERDYYSSLTIEQKLNTMQELRETIEKFGNENRKRLRRVLKIIKQE